MCRTYVEDMIDFPVSDNFRDFYFGKGQSPFHSPTYAKCPERQLASTLTAAVRDLQNTIVETTQALASAASGTATPQRSPDSFPCRPPSQSW